MFRTGFNSPFIHEYKGEKILKRMPEVSLKHT